MPACFLSQYCNQYNQPDFDAGRELFAAAAPCVFLVLEPGEINTVGVLWELLARGLAGEGPGPGLAFVAGLAAGLGSAGTTVVLEGDVAVAGLAAVGEDWSEAALLAADATAMLRRPRLAAGEARTGGGDLGGGDLGGGGLLAEVTVVKMGGGEVALGGGGGGVLAGGGGGGGEGDGGGGRRGGEGDGGLEDGMGGFGGLGDGGRGLGETLAGGGGLRGGDRACSRPLAPVPVPVCVGRSSSPAAGQQE
jgi:hypothetical protein